ncbi:MAG TPA: hypothetical protein ENK09_01755 [Nitrospirae bacterium]|nr:hypothetical protein [Nitrospirota bacterium]
MSTTKDIGDLFVSGDFKPLCLEGREQKLTFAIYMIDDYTASLPEGRIDLRISRGGERPVRNRDGYYCFLNLADGQYTVEISSAFYLREKTTVNTATLKEKKPVIVVRLKPAPSYPFPSYATLLRGMLKEGTEPAGDANVTVEATDGSGFTLNTKTAGNGEFVIYIKPPKVKRVRVEFKRDGKTAIKEVNIEKKVGETVSLGIVELSN